MKAEFSGDGDVIVITGGANGIGAALALACADAGASVVVGDVDTDSAAVGGTPGIELLPLNVADPGAVKAFVSDVVARHGRIDGLVAGAAIQPRQDVIDTSESDWREVLDVNLNGAVWCCQAVLPHMLAQRAGTIVLFTSGLASTGRAQAAAYAASKAGLVAFAKSLAAEVADDRVRVNVIAPGVIDTRQFRAANAGEELGYWLEVTGIGQPEDVVGPLLFLLSDAATMTGSTLTRERAYPREPEASWGVPAASDTPGGVHP